MQIADPTQRPGVVLMSLHFSGVPGGAAGVNGMENH